jgi:hypothetical protein
VAPTFRSVTWISFRPDVSPTITFLLFYCFRQSKKFTSTTYNLYVRPIPNWRFASKLVKGPIIWWHLALRPCASGLMLSSPELKATSSFTFDVFFRWHLFWLDKQNTKQWKHCQWNYVEAVSCIKIFILWRRGKSTTHVPIWRWFEGGSYLESLYFYFAF